MQQQQHPGGGAPLAAGAGLSSLLMQLASTVRKKAVATATAAAEAPPKRGRGRPRKHPLPPVAHHAPNSRALMGGPASYAAYAAHGSFQSDDEDSSDEDPVPVTARHQALLPPLRPLPSEPPPSEARYLAAPLVYDAHAHAGSAAPAPPPISASEFKALYRATPPGSARRGLLADVIEALNQQMGPQLVQDLGLSLLGANLQQTWQPHEELLFCLGMCDKYRMFKYIRQCYLRARSVHELNGYYHNVWKTHSSAVAEGFLGLRDAGADYDDLEAFAEGIRQQLTAIWDVQCYGSMPPTAASPRARALLANQQQQQQQQQQNMGRGSSNSLMPGCYTQHTAAAGASGGLESTSFAAAAAPPPRAAAEVGRACADAEVQPTQQQQQQPRITVLSLKPQGGQQAGTPGRVQLLPTLPQQQQPASAASPAGHSGGPQLQLPALPDLPMPNAAMSVESWLQALPGYRQGVADFKQQVAQQCDSATQQEQQRIQQLQATCAASLQDADAAAQAVSRQEQQLIAQLELLKQQQQHAAGGEPAAQRQKQAGAGAGPQQQQPSAQMQQSVHAHHIKVAAAAAAGAAAALKSAGRPAVPMEQLQGAVMQLLQQEQVRQQPAAPSQPKRSGSSRQRPRVHVTWCHPHPANAAAVKQEAPGVAGAAAGAAPAVAADAGNARKRPVGAADGSSLPGVPAQDSSASAGKKQRQSPSTASMSVTPQDADAAALAAAAGGGASQDDAACLAY